MKITGSAISISAFIHYKNSNILGGNVIFESALQEVQYFPNFENHVLINTS